MIDSKKKCIIVVFLQCCVGLSLINQSYAAEVNDPLEPVNRIVWNMNTFFDRWAVKPVTKMYKAVTPDVVERGFSNFFRNIGNIPVSMNNLLQGKPGQAGQDITRFIFNMTFGGFGFYDFASDIGLPMHEEDFGQTLGVWGVPQGPYLVLPFLGPSSMRDMTGWVVDQQYDLYNEIEPQEDRLGVLALRIVDIRAQLLHLDNLAPGDEYLFFRDAYMQRRAGLVVDGQQKLDKDDDFLNDDF